MRLWTESYKEFTNFDCLFLQLTLQYLQSLIVLEILFLHFLFVHFPPHPPREKSKYRAIIKSQKQESYRWKSITPYLGIQLAYSFCVDVVPKRHPFIFSSKISYLKEHGSPSIMFSLFASCRVDTIDIYPDLSPLIMVQTRSINGMVKQ